MAILAAVLMACTAFVLLADSSEADSYNDAAAFRTAMNPRIADAPGAFDVTINAGDPLPAISAGQTVLVRNGATLDCGAGITLTDITASTVAPDFARNARIHRCYTFAKE